ncbi:hypothetical protein CTO_0992 [Chlamydia trachomatis A2497]|uniref:Uncharacterized protein n=1 Tax=Chlamydia trachomatis serovar A (strain A2497) TaxID=580047 RepID=G4NN10_CHLT4|nr:hypothetical protein G9768_03325 [Chlamydia trachomatis G/9768]ADH19268.1 hypothetical protein G11222_03345 [Chlamydia trachomatis G/11222]ADH20191.1 hypothetical protein G11074_03325 [Chlamydia trachomatis G/11074]ADH97290.1 hypothetical protein CTG9301_03340 [Chlamydia trachomatis G/9301]AEP35508.1 hypothetical protein CTO_0992 [Chlamydia trachomatis A2497]AGR94069.1 hypothetical protein CTRC69_03360 [Chlamydia trachomatis RC-F/69]AGR95915.1 hypothetical protein CTRC852_03395 [Chlamydia 
MEIVYNIVISREKAVKIMFITLFTACLNCLEQKVMPICKQVVNKFFNKLFAEKL